MHDPDGRSLTPELKPHHLHRGAAIGSVGIAEQFLGLQVGEVGQFDQRGLVAGFFERRRKVATLPLKFRVSKVP